MTREGGKAGVPLLEEGVFLVNKDITVGISQEVSLQNYSSCDHAKILLQYRFYRIYIAVRETLWLFDTSLSIVFNYSLTGLQLMV